MANARKLVWIDVVGMTPRLLRHAPTLASIAERGSTRALEGVLPAVTATAQATVLTGTPPSVHGVVGNGWFHRDTGEVRFWLQSNALVQAETLYAAAHRLARAQGRAFTCAKLFWWFNQGAPVDWSLTPKPWYGADGSKAFGIHGWPPDLAPRTEARLGPFPFHAFWGPLAGLPSSDWIARAAALVVREERPDLTLVYLPHLDYDLQRLGPEHDDVPARVAEVDRCVATVVEAAREAGAEVLALSEYGLAPVARSIRPNRALREAGLLAVRDGPFGETLETFHSRAFAVCDHQVAHVHVREVADREDVARRLAGLPGVARVLDATAKAEAGLDHPRAGDFVLLAEPDAWFAYDYWLDASRAPDFARTVDIHRKPGYDPNELFFDPAIRFPKAAVARRLVRKRLGLRTRMDVIPLEADLVRGSHGLAPADPDDGPLLVADDPGAAAAVAALADLKSYGLRRLDLAEDAPRTR